MAIIRPRLNDFHHIPLRQEDIDFAIPFLDEDIPLYVDPFLLWKIPSMQDNALHATVVSAFNQLGALFTRGNETEAVTTLISLTECDEIGLGNSKTKVGKKIGGKAANEILNLFKNIPQVQASGFAHFEEIQLLVDGISKDRISDITCSILKSFLIDYTAQSCEKYHIPMEKVDITVYDYKVQKLVVENIFLPTNPAAKSPILFAPRRWLRFSPWINYEDYFEHHYIKDPANHFADRKNRVEILEYNRYNYPPM